MSHIQPCILQKQRHILWNLLLADARLAAADDDAFGLLLAADAVVQVNVSTGVVALDTFEDGVHQPRVSILKIGILIKLLNLQGKLVIYGHRCIVVVEYGRLLHLQVVPHRASLHYDLLLDRCPIPILYLLYLIVLHLLLLSELVLR